MIQLIRTILFLYIATTITLMANSDFSFFKAIDFCDDSDVGMYSQKEANNLFFSKRIKIDDYNYQKKISLTDFFFQNSTKCLERSLNIKVDKSELYESKQEWPFEKMILVNNQYLITVQDGYYFIFSKDLESHNLIKKQINEEFNVTQLIESSYTETYQKKLKNFKVDNFEVSFKKDNLWINRENKEDSHGHLLLNSQSLTAILITNNKEEILFKQEEFTPYGQDIITLTCKQPNNQTLLFIQTQFASSSNIDPWYIQFEPYAYEINQVGDIQLSQQIIDQYFYGQEYFKRRISDTEKPTISYPFYDKRKILEKLYETDVCIKPLLNLKSIEQTLKEKKQLEIYNQEFFQNLLEAQMLTPKTLTQYNNIAYYLEQAGAYKESAYLLEKIIEKYPTRTVAHYNLGDAYWGLGEKEKAIASYNTYIQQMKANGKEKRIPQVVLDRVNTPIK